MDSTADKTKEMSDMLMAIVGDLETCVGFLLAGIGHDVKGKRNFLIVEKGAEENLCISVSNHFKIIFICVATSNDEIEAFVISVMQQRNDVAILLVAVDIAERIKTTLKRFERKISPVFLIIPTKLQPYDVNADAVVNSAKVSQQRVEHTQFYFEFICRLSMLPFTAVGCRPRRGQETLG